MKYKKLGNTGLEVSRIGFGACAIGGHDYGKVDDNESRKAIRKALDCGINFFDTADVYGFGHSEEILGSVIGKQRDDVIIATKFGVAWDESGKTYRNSSPGYVKKAVEASLKRLRIDTIDLYQIHWPDGNTPIEDTIDVLQTCIREGKIRYIGCSNFDDSLVNQVQKYCSLSSQQVSYSLADRSNEDSIIKLGRNHNMGIIAYNVLARGLFSGKYQDNKVFEGTDTRSRDRFFDDNHYTRLTDCTKTLAEISGRHGFKPAQCAISWTLKNKYVTTAIVGAKTEEQVQENARAVELEISSDEYNELVKKSTI